MLCGSAQTLSSLGSISSSDKSGPSATCASSFPDSKAATAVQGTYKLSRNQPPLTELIIISSSSSLSRDAAFPLASGAPSALVSETAGFRLGRRLGLLFVLLRSSARDGVIGARSQIDEYVIEIAHDVRIHAERRHDALLRRVDVLPP